MRQRILDRAPFGRKLGKRIKHRLAGFVGTRQQKREWRLIRSIRNKSNQRVSLGRAFDQHAVGRVVLQSRTQTKRGPRPVVANAENACHEAI